MAEGGRPEVTDKLKGRSGTSSAAGEERYPDPSGLYQQWFGALEGSRDGEKEATMSPAELGELWKRWFEATMKPRGGAAEVEDGPPDVMKSLRAEMAEDVSAKMLSGETLPEDPLRFFLQWYNDTEERWAEAADELLRKDEALTEAGRSLEVYARSYRELLRVSEEGSKNIGVPSRSDVTRVAKLVVLVEDKVDRIEEAFEEFIHGDSEPVTAEALTGAVDKLDERMNRLESKMDHILTALERIEAGGGQDSGASRGSATKKDHRTARESSADRTKEKGTRANSPGYS